MTANEIAYLNYLENQRSNMAREEETNRSNVAKEVETNRHNVADESLGSRKQDEVERDNEYYRWSDVAKLLSNDIPKGILNWEDVAAEIPLSLDDVAQLLGLDNILNWAGNASGLIPFT